MTSYCDMITAETQGLGLRHKSQNPSIFEKTLQLPPRLPGLPPAGKEIGSILKQPEAIVGGTVTFASKMNGQSSSKNLEKPQTAQKSQLKGSQAVDDVGFLNYDWNLCSSQIEL